MHQTAQAFDFSRERSREGLRAVGLALLVLGGAAALQAVIFVATDSVALLADLLHNIGDAATAIPVGIAFFMRSRRAERLAGIAVVLAILISAIIAGYEAILRLIEPRPPTDLLVLALGGAIGAAGNWIAAIIRSNAGRRLDSAALIADGHHARADALVSVAVIVTAVLVALGFELADPIVGLLITAGILRITWHAWLEVRAGNARSRDHEQGHEHSGSREDAQT